MTRTAALCVGSGEPVTSASASTTRRSVAAMADGASRLGSGARGWPIFQVATTGPFGVGANGPVRSIWNLYGLEAPPASGSQV
ncbi:hypothetical protein [Planomonospora algeriensis]